MLLSPRNKEELFNLHHMSTYNIIKWMFGILKHNFDILNHTPFFNMLIQCCIPAALASIHNFILCFNPDMIENVDESEVHDIQPGLSLLAQGPAGHAERDQVNAQWDQIALDMWNQYQDFLTTDI